MTKEEALKLLRNNPVLPPAFITLTSEQAREIADMLAPPQPPAPGTVVQCTHKESSWTTSWLGLVAYDRRGVYGESGFHKWNEIEYRPVYTVTPPPLEAWMDGDKAWHCHEHAAWLSIFHNTIAVGGTAGRHIATVTREEMEQDD